jgi:type I restriction enzyme M protein
MSPTAPIVSKVWSFCTILKDDGVSYGDYLEQLTYLIFLKMADEYSKPPHNRNVGIPKQYSWQTLKSKKGAGLEVHYVELLMALGKKKGLLGQIFTKAQNKIQDPAKLYRLIDMVDDTEWVTMGADVKGDIYEGLLEKNAEDTKSGAGQYFTPRALIRAMVECVRPEPGKTIADPACGTGGFFLAAYDFITNPNNYKLDKAQKAFLKHMAFHGNEIVANTRRLCLMNMFLHNIGEIDGEGAVSPNDALVAPSPKTFDYVLANPPFGKKSSMSFTNEEGEQETDDLTYNRQDFWATTSNKQLNFVQHIRSMLKTTGKAAVVVPDNVLFEGGAGETIRRKLLENTDLHTILRLPTGIFYAHGVKANVIFFDNREASPKPWTKEVWYYDYRTNIHHTLKKKTLRFEDLAEFIRKRFFTDLLDANQSCVNLLIGNRPRQ